MKLKITIALCALLVITACKKKPSETKDNDSITITNTEQRTGTSTSSKNIKDCDDFLNTYESWTDDLLELMAKHKDDPITLATSPEYINTMTEGMSFIQDWQTIALSCSTDDSYEKRMKAIQQKMNDKQKELGFK
ncbi:hypothetical protein [Winogradskyella sp.]|uniref:hypothetical protein n=1 Tax=Winogradskyella sp. TaxID=1883156 RepID=UPI0025E1D0A2|nr:hypothetical protein [Winogradskyella sp.]